MTYRDRDVDVEVEVAPTAYVILWSVLAIIGAVIGWVVVP